MLFLAANHLPKMHRERLQEPNKLSELIYVFSAKWVLLLEPI